MSANASEDKILPSDGLHVIEDTARQQKYPAILSDVPKFLASSEPGELCLQVAENSRYRPEIVHEPIQDGKGVAQKRSNHPRKKFLTLCLLVFAMVILAATLGGILGSRKSKISSNINQKTNNGTSSSNATPTSIATNHALAYKGTSLTAVAYMHAEDLNYVLFFQDSVGSIRKAIYNGTGWHKPSFVANDSALGTGLSTNWMPDASQSTEKIYLYYTDKDNKLQELRGTHASDIWTRGSLGSFGYQTAPSSAIGAIFPGFCKSGTSTWLFYQTVKGSTNELRYNYALDSWVHGLNITDISKGASLMTYTNNVPGVWRLYTADTEQISQWDCFHCCGPKVNWERGLSYTYNNTIPAYTNGTAAVDGKGILYYQASDGWIRSLNNSGLASNETFNIGSLILQTALPGTKITIADGSHFGQSVKAFYQTNGSNIVATSWLVDNTGEKSTVDIRLEN